MYFIRMMFLWCMLILGARCSDTEIPLERAEQSSTASVIGFSCKAAHAIDKKASSYSKTKKENPAWLSVYFQSSSAVEKVVIQGKVFGTNCVITVSVYDGGTGAVCGTYTKPNKLVQVL